MVTKLNVLKKENVGSAKSYRCPCLVMTRKETKGTEMNLCCCSSYVGESGEAEVVDLGAHHGGILYTGVYCK